VYTQPPRMANTSIRSRMIQDVKDDRKGLVNDSHNSDEVLRADQINEGVQYTEGGKAIV
jgi:hypothetical protein